MIIYEVTQNSDLTEGRGHEVPVAFFINEADAVQAAQGRGVMGVGPGNVNALYVFSSFAEFENPPSGWIASKRVYGYRKDWAGKWGYGYVDNRDAPINDPDYKTYLALKMKFEEN